MTYLLGTLSAVAALARSSRQLRPEQLLEETRMGEWFTLWLSHFGLLFALIDPVGYVPVFLSMTSSHTRERRQTMLRKA